MIVDLSHYQGDIDWEQLAPNLDFVILRSSVGSNIDNKYNEYAHYCRQYNIPFGCYHYIKSASPEKAIIEANHYYDIASVENPNFYVADVEFTETINADYDLIAKTFIEQLRKRGAKTIGLYIPQRLYPLCKLTHPLIDFSWIPRYGKNNGKYEKQYAPTCECDLHQYTSVGTIPGISGNVDLNRITSNYFKERFNMAYVMTAKEMINKCIDIATNYKTIYMYACYGFQVTDKTIANKKAQNNNTWYTRNPSAVRKLEQVANQTPPTWGFDCVNLLKGILWGWTGDASKEKGGAVYAANGVPDTNANGMFSRCLNQSSDFSNIQPGEAVWLEQHIGLYIGDNLVVECTPSFSNKVLISGLANVANSSKYPNRKWAKHGFLPWLDYEGLIDYTPEIPKEKEYKLGERTLKKGSEGKDVKELQELLISLGYDLGSYGADGEFGSATEKAIKQFQKDNEMTADGEFGQKSYNKLVEITSDKGGENVEEPEEDEPTTTPVTKNGYTITGKSVYLWDRHPSYGGTKAQVVRQGEVYEKPELGTYVPIIYKGTLKWINSKYIK